MTTEPTLSPERVQAALHAPNVHPRHRALLALVAAGLYFPEIGSVRVGDVLFTPNGRSAQVRFRRCGNLSALARRRAAHCLVNGVGVPALRDALRDARGVFRGPNRPLFESQRGGGPVSAEGLRDLAVRAVLRVEGRTPPGGGS